MLSDLFSLPTSGSLQLMTISTVLLVYGCPTLFPSLSIGFVLSIFHHSQQTQHVYHANELDLFLPPQRSFIEFFQFRWALPSRKCHSMRSKMYWRYARCSNRGFLHRSDTTNIAFLRCENEILSIHTFHFFILPFFICI